VRKTRRKTVRTRRSRRNSTEKKPTSVSSLLTFPIQWRQLEDEQRRQTSIYQKARLNVDNWSMNRVQSGKFNIVMRHNKYFIPTGLENNLIQWYHEMLRHPGASRLYKTLNKKFYVKGLRSKINRHVRACRTCQTYKRSNNKKYGKLPAKKLNNYQPWDTVCVDLIGPYSVETDKGDVTLHCLTIIDPVTYWVEVVEIKNKTAEEVALQFDRTWLSRYPRPNFCIFDKGSEFIGKEFQEMLESFGIEPQPITTKNPQANAIIERMHGTLGDMLRTYELDKQSFDDTDPWTGYLTSIAWALRSTIYTTLDTTPAELVFGRDMIMPIQFKADWEKIRVKRQLKINKDNERENKRRIKHNYNVGDKILVTDPISIKRKLDKAKEGPFIVTRVHKNGTARIQKGAVDETLSLRRIIPFME
jgi:transposase InsO family protein